MLAERGHPGHAPAPRRAGVGGAMRRLIGLAALAAAVVLPAPIAAAQDEVAPINRKPKEIDGLEVPEMVGERVPLDVQLVDSTGQVVPFSKMFDGEKPVILAMVYYDCPVACPAILGKLQELFKKLDHTIGQDYNVAIVSFDHGNTTEMAAEAKAAYLLGYNADERGVPAEQVEAGWEFFTASALSARTLADAIGFGYRYVPETGEFAHPTFFTVLTPDGVVSRYFYGFNYPPRDVKIALLEASDGKTARTLGDRLLLFCYHFDPKRGSYTLQAFRVMQLGGLVTLVLVGGLVAGLKLAESKRSIARKTDPGPTPGGPAATGHRA